MKNFETIKSLKEKNEKWLFSNQGIHTVGIGYKDENSEELAVLVYVESQEAVERLANTENDFLTSNSDSVKIIVTPRMSFDILRISDDNEVTGITAVNEDYGRYRPIIGGIQLYLTQNSSAWLGTLGIFVKSNNVSDKNLYILSNQHVLVEKGLAVCQPLIGAGNIIGTVTFADNFPDTDAALALINDPNDVSTNTIENIGTVNETKNLTVDDLRKRVIKRGRTTILTEGTIESINSTVYITGRGEVKDCVIVRADDAKVFSAPGDSGSPVILKDETKLVGLHFAGNQTPGGISIFCTIENIFKNLNVKLP